MARVREVKTVIVEVLCCAMHFGADGIAEITAAVFAAFQGAVRFIGFSPAELRMEIVVYEDDDAAKIARRAREIVPKKYRPKTIAELEAEERASSGKLLG